MKQLLWTIQREEAYLQMERSGVLRANEAHLFCGEDLRFAYDWMAGQMRKRLGEPPESVRYPVWAWYQWEGKRGPRDLRCSGYDKRGAPLVQIAFEADPGVFLLSDFDRWHNVLNCQYVASNEVEWEDFYSVNPHPMQKELESSWASIFDITHYNPPWDCDPGKACIQATLWQIKMTQVKQVRRFVAK